MLRVYTASKLEEYTRWLKLQETHPGVFFHARWIKHMQIGTEDRESRAQEFWIQDQEDVESADVLLLYATPGRVMKGALIEAGMAISKGVPVIVVGNEDIYGTWIYHPGVTITGSLDEAISLIDKLNIGRKTKYTNPNLKT